MGYVIETYFMLRSGDMIKRRKKTVFVWIGGILCIFLTVYCVKELHAYYVLLQLRANLRPGNSTKDATYLTTEPTTLHDGQSDRLSKLPSKLVFYSDRETTVLTFGQCAMLLSIQEDHPPNYNYSTRSLEYIVYLGDFKVEEFLKKNLPDVEGPGPHQPSALPNHGLERKLPDPRSHLCNTFHEHGTQLATSVVIVYHDERRDTLLRAVYSVLLRSPPELITEIILVDDNSKDEAAALYLSRIPKVKLVRNKNYEGFVRSSNIGANMASGDILTFLSPKCEVNIGWLEPLVQRISRLPNAVVVPVLDKIHPETLEYIPSNVWQKGGFDWSMNFRWEEAGAHTNLNNHIVRTPIIPGHSFSISHQRFIKLGKFDPGLDLHGGENIELSLKNWMCGGEVEILPCSHVGQVDLASELAGVLEGKENIYLRNIKRVAEVWMEDYKRFFYYSKPSVRMIGMGSVMERKSIKKYLKCQSFKWYLTNVYPELKLPVTDELLYGQIQQGEWCIDIEVGHVPAIAKLSHCETDKDTQGWSMKKKGEITNGGMCLTADAVETHGYVMVHFCTKDKTQRWQFVKGQIIREGTNMCLDSHKAEVGLVVSDCDEVYQSQQWKLSSKPTQNKDGNLAEL